MYEDTEKVRLIRDRLKTIFSQQNAHINNRKTDHEFEVGDWVYFKTSPMKGAMRFGKKRKLSPYYVGQYEIIKGVGIFSYELKFTNELAMSYPVFHVFSALKVHR